MDCRLLGEILHDANGDFLTVLVPCSSCGSTGGKSPRTVWECDHFGKCVPNYSPTPKQREKFNEAAAIALCHGCPHFTPPA